MAIELLKFRTSSLFPHKTMKNEQESRGVSQCFFKSRFTWQSFKPHGHLVDKQLAVSTERVAGGDRDNEDGH